jgi:hypothetical protein
LVCPLGGCSGVLRPWGWARARGVRGVGEVGWRLRPRRSRCGSCKASHVLLPASVLLRRADEVEVIGSGLRAVASGRGYRGVAADLDRPVSTVRGWVRRVRRVADRVLGVLGVAAGGFGTVFVPPAPAAGPVGAVVEMVGALGRAAGRLLGGWCWAWRLVAVISGSRLLVPAGPDLVVGVGNSINTSGLLAASGVSR